MADARSAMDMANGFAQVPCVVIVSHLKFANIFPDPHLPTGGVTGVDPSPCLFHEI